MFKVYVSSNIPNCPSCVKAKALLDTKDIEYELIDMNNPEGRALFGKNGWKTIPQVLNGEEYIGGFEDLAIYVASWQYEDKKEEAVVEAQVEPVEEVKKRGRPRKS